MKLVLASDPILRQDLDKFDFSNPPTDPAQLAQDLVDFMRAEHGIGLSANQVGLNYRVFVMEGEPAHACFNPRVVAYGSEQVTLEEGCLSFPGLLMKVQRSRDVKVRFEGPDGETYTKTFTGMTARVFQHEFDHLNGWTMHNKAQKLHREQALSRWKKWKRKNEHLLHSD